MDLLILFDLAYCIGGGTPKQGIFKILIREHFAFKMTSSCQAVVAVNDLTSLCSAEEGTRDFLHAW